MQRWAPWMGNNANAKELKMKKQFSFFFLTWKLTEEENSLGALRLQLSGQGPCSLMAAAGTLADPHPALHPV